MKPNLKDHEGRIENLKKEFKEHRKWDMEWKFADLFCLFVLISAISAFWIWVIPTQPFQSSITFATIDEMVLRCECSKEELDDCYGEIRGCSEWFEKLSEEEKMGSGCAPRHCGYKCSEWECREETTTTLPDFICREEITCVLREVGE